MIEKSPNYKHVVELLEDLIRGESSHQLPMGDEIMNEHKWVTRSSLRHAKQNLEARGVIKRRRGGPALVMRREPLQVNLGDAGFLAQASRREPGLHNRIIEARMRRAEKTNGYGIDEEMIWRQMNHSTGQLFVVARMRFSGKNPIARHVAYINPEMVDVDEMKMFDFEKRSLMDIYKEMELTMRGGTVRFGARKRGKTDPQFTAEVLLTKRLQRNGTRGDDKTVRPIEILDACYANWEYEISFCNQR